MLNRGDVCFGKYDDLNVHEAILDLLLSFLDKLSLMPKAAEALFFSWLRKFDRIGNRRSGDRQMPATRASPDFRSLPPSAFMASLQAAIASASPTPVA
jgi:hypothetical protein